MNYKYLILSLFLIVGVFFSGCTQQMTADEIAKKMQEKYEAINTMEGNLVMTLNVNGKIETIQYKYSFKKPNKYYMENDDVLIVSDGKIMYLYDKKSNKYMKTEISGENPYNPDYGKFIKEMLNEYDVKYLGEENYDNKKCYVLELTSKKDPTIKIKMYVDEDYWQPLKIETKDMIIEYKNVKFDVDIPDSKFTFTPPEGAELISSGKIATSTNIDEIQKEVNFKILIPKYTAGLKLQKANLAKQNVDGEEFEMVSLVYGESGDLIIMEMKDIGNQMDVGNKITLNNGVNAAIYESNGYTALTFSYNGVRVSIMSKLSKDELIKIANSMIE
ncbi:outer membrane lipoprotein carrier protein LolA [Methanocaldococcus bathoardescens]|uniref:Outer membrane lipoprotein carrier protein LolA n=1 Tax=Methanocaldococcus bathoardescens TaxID=1301915 RepID=A0A076LC79_9EURY|nr:outer membrane lipoprotein carrier protein LolA [Methanocaldococcus bathoardescens]AIJ06055.1 outer membrane lipoprotein carrier protein LolA [Methanocaldococcus bathoardescens]